MSTVVQVPEVRIRGVVVSEDAITVSLLDGRVVSVPLSWSWRLAEASPEQRERYEIIGDGQGGGGRSWTRISARRASSRACLRVDRCGLRPR